MEVGYLHAVHVVARISHAYLLDRENRALGMNTEACTYDERPYPILGGNQPRYSPEI